MKIRWMLIVAVIFAGVAGIGYRLTQYEPEIVSAAEPSVVVDRVISQQATSVEEVQARHIQPLVDANTTFTDQLFGYRISYPANWLKTALSSNVVAFQAPNGATRVKVEVAGTLPVDGLTAFVDRSLGQNILMTRQSLTIHSLPAERVVVYSDTVGETVTNFYINADNMVYVISGSGEQQLIESVARSFNAPQVIALK